ncbi:uncharacterized protein [Nerophis lumbriciformis]|uniref:uncharacterized protein n=1 Tax=Nerophis lumbriciformis TaxID=546530 RepID=UPI002AE00245|nr:uncharacterized protein LOC133577130 [Nerophis lumbriciformis]
MPSCAAWGCFTRQKSGKHMHRFPRDPVRRKVWEVKVRRDGWRPNNYSLLCEDHFDETQYEQRRADGLKKLKPNAVPTLFAFTTKIVKPRRLLKRNRVDASPPPPSKRIRMEHSYYQQSLLTGTREKPIHLSEDGIQEKPVHRSEDEKPIYRWKNGTRKKPIRLSEDGTREKQIYHRENGSWEKPIQRSEDDNREKVIHRSEDGSLEKLIHRSEDGRLEKPIHRSEDGTLEKLIHRIEDGNRKKLIHHREDGTLENLMHHSDDGNREKLIHHSDCEDGNREKLIHRSDGEDGNREKPIHHSEYGNGEKPIHRSENDDTPDSPDETIHTFAPCSPKSAPGVAESSLVSAESTSRSAESRNERLKKMTTEISRLKKLLAKERREKRKLLQQQSNLEVNISKVFNRDQLGKLKQASPRGMKWSAETIKKGLQLKVACGATGYEALLSQNLPLPSARSLRRRLHESRSEVHQIHTQNCPQIIL